MQDNRQGNVWVWVGIAVVVIVIILAFVWHPSAKVPPPPGTAVHASQGQVVGGFPQNLLLDSAAQISNSYSINYSSSTNQYTAAWNSSSSLADETSEYQQYLQANGWRVTPNPVTQSTIRALSAGNGSATLLVNIVAQGKGSQVTLTYVTR
jgi:hypothetical protein